jgi:hypothetical protein
MGDDYKRYPAPGHRYRLAAPFDGLPAGTVILPNGHEEIDFLSPPPNRVGFEARVEGDDTLRWFRRRRDEVLTVVYVGPV